MLPTEFLSQIADKYGLSSEQTEVFLLKFGSDKSNKEIMVACHMPEGTLNHHMGKVYQKFSIAGSGTGKAAKLLSFLTGEYQKYKPSSVSSSGASKDELEETTAKKRVVVDEAIPVVPVWQGRDELLEDLLERLLQSENRLKVLALVGQGGIGKTSLVVKLLEALGVDLAGKSFVEKERTPLTPLNKGRTPLTPLVKGRTPLTPLVKGTTPLTPLNKGGSLWGECPYECVMYFKAQEGSSFDDVAEFLLRKGLGSETAESLKDASEKIAKIIEGLEKTRCLVVLDNLESILHPAKGADDAGEMSAPKAHRAISADWGKLLNALVYQQHRSQTILTSREVPADLADRRYEGAEPDSELVWIETLRGVKTEAGVEILRQRQLKDTEADLLWVSERVEGHVFLLTQLAAVGKGKPGYLRKHPELVTKKAEPILREQLARQSEVARDLLRRMCVLRAGIDIRGLTFLRLYRDDEEEFGRFSMAAVMEEPAELMDEEINETEAILERLIDSSLVQCRYDEEKCEEFYDLHRVIVEFLQAEYKDELPNLLNSVYQFYRTGKNVENPQALEDLRPVLEAQHFAFQLGKYSEAWSLLKWNIEDYLEPWGNWSLLKDLYEQILPHVDDDDRPYCLRAIGCIHRDCGNWNEAENYFQDALSLSQEQDSKSGIATSLGLLGDIERHRGNWDEAQRLYRQSLELMTQLGDRSGMATSWGQLGDIERNRGNWDEAQRLYRQYLELMTQLGDRSGMATSWGVLGDIERNRGNWDEAERLYRQSLELRTQLGDRFRIATSLGLLGDIERNRGNWDEAERLYRQSLELRTQLGDRSGMATSWGLLGYIERNRGNWDEAERLYRQALEIETQLGDRSGMATSWASLGDIERNRGNWDEAERLFRQCLEIQTQLGDRSGMATSWASLGDIERNRGNWDEAERLFRQCLEIETQLGDRSGMASCWGMLGDIECNRSNWDEAERLYRQALELRTQLGDRSGMATSIGCLGEIEMLRGNLEAAEPLIKDALATLQELGSTQKVAEAYYDLARLERRRTNTELAQQHYNTAHQIFQQLGAAKDLEKIEQEWKQNF